MFAAVLLGKCVLQKLKGQRRLMKYILKFMAMANIKKKLLALVYFFFDL